MITGLSHPCARAVASVCRLHDRLDLFEIIDVERRQAVAVLGGVIEQLAHGNERHCISP